MAAEVDQKLPGKMVGIRVVVYLIHFVLGEMKKFGNNVGLHNNVNINNVAIIVSWSFFQLISFSSLYHITYILSVKEVYSNLQSCKPEARGNCLQFFFCNSLLISVLHSSVSNYLFSKLFASSNPQLATFLMKTHPILIQSLIIALTFIHDFLNFSSLLLGLIENMHGILSKLPLSAEQFQRSQFVAQLDPSCSTSSALSSHMLPINLILSCKHNKTVAKCLSASSLGLLKGLYLPDLFILQTQHSKSHVQVAFRCLSSV